jgi:chemotaxis protein CheZ
MKAQYLEHARDLVRHLEDGNDTEAEKCLDNMMQLRESKLFQELGKLTREFHTALNAFRMDDRIVELADKEIPDARERLQYVVSKTEDAANKTLDFIEDSLPVCGDMQQKAQEMSVAWARFTRKEMDADEFRTLSKTLGNTFDEFAGSLGKIQAGMNEVMMAQDYQDLTSQIINRVIGLVGELEKSLAELIRIAGEHFNAEIVHNKKEKKSAVEVEGPHVPGLGDAEVVSGQDEVDDILSSFGF